MERIPTSLIRSFVPGETMRIADVVDVNEHLNQRSERMTNTTVEPALSQAEIVGLARTYISLRNELMERGETLAKAMNLQKPKTLIVADGNKFYELSRNYSVGRYELPIGVADAEILGLDQ